MLDFARQLLDLLRDAIAMVGPEQSRVLALALLLSHASTQFFKLLPPVLALREAARDLIVRAWAVSTGAMPVLLLYPAPMDARLVTAAAVGFASPCVYWLLLQACKRWAPWIVPKMSGDPDHVDLRP